MGLGPESAAALRAYKYKSGGYSALDNFMNPFWEATVKLFPLVRRSVSLSFYLSVCLSVGLSVIVSLSLSFSLCICHSVIQSPSLSLPLSICLFPAASLSSCVPLVTPRVSPQQWFAPNLITLVGTCCLALGCGVALWYSPTLSGPLPPWTCWLQAACVFAYSTLDAIDGKQARRTGASSPLGQLFDHGCDALGCTLIMLPFCALLELGLTAATCCMLVAVIAPFFLAQWEEYHTHSIRTFVGYIGVTEAQYILVACHFASGFVSDTSALWQTPVLSLFGLDVTPARCAVTFQCVMCALAAVSFLHNVLVVQGKPAAAKQLLPITLHIAVSLASAAPVSAVGPRAAPYLFLLGQSLTISFLTTQMIVFGLCRTAYPLWQGTVALGALPLLNLYFDAPVPHAPLQVAVAVCAAAVYGRWVAASIAFICDVLNINCLTITAKDKQ